ncbi:MAG: thioredoxin family protein [Planctomycetia bacterium]|nr:thioredoxin family protein [Planctomycetia bacterium]
MHCPVTTPLVLYPLITVAALVSALPVAAQPARPMPAPAQVTWRTDYNAARKEATEKELPLIIVIGTDDCFYCRKLEAGPLKDPTVAGLLAKGFIAVKLDATRAPELAKALKVQLYPTTVLAGPDGKIHAFIEGYIEADRLVEQMKRTVTAVTTADWMARDYNEASKALAVSDYARAITLLKGVVKEAGGKPIGTKSKQVLDEIERLAAGRLVRAKDLEQKGQTLEAMDLLADTVKLFAGTQAATDATALLTGLAEKPEAVAKKRQRTARDLLAEAKDEFRTGQLYDCLLKCERLSSAFADLPEAKEAAALLTDIRGNPERLAKVCEQMNERTAAMYLALADSWVKKGQFAEASACLKKVIALCPNTKQADIAQAELTKIQSKGTPTGGQKP